MQIDELYGRKMEVVIYGQSRKILKQWKVGKFNLNSIIILIFLSFLTNIAGSNSMVKYNHKNLFSALYVNMVYFAFLLLFAILISC